MVEKMDGVKIDENNNFEESLIEFKNSCLFLKKKKTELKKKIWMLWLLFENEKDIIYDIINQTVSFLFYTYSILKRTEIYISFINN